MNRLTVDHFELIAGFSTGPDAAHLAQVCRAAAKGAGRYLALIRRAFGQQCIEEGSIDHPEGIKGTRWARGIREDILYFDNGVERPLTNYFHAHERTSKERLARSGERIYFGTQRSWREQSQFIVRWFSHEGEQRGERFFSGAPLTRLEAGERHIAVVANHKVAWIHPLLIEEKPVFLEADVKDEDAPTHLLVSGNWTIATYMSGQIRVWLGQQLAMKGVYPGDRALPRPLVASNGSWLAVVRPDYPEVHLWHLGLRVYVKGLKLEEKPSALEFNGQELRVALAGNRLQIFK